MAKTIIVLTARRANESPEQWDEFAIRCNSSFRASYRGAIAWQLNYHAFFRLKRFALFIENDRQSIKIAQVAIGLGHSIRVFADSLIILPEYRHMWCKAISVLLDQLGPGLYLYGSQWSFEPSRHLDLANVAGVSVQHVQAITVNSIDFSRWPTWEAYYKDISNNARRNAGRANSLDIHILQQSGLRSIRFLPHLLRLRKKLYENKKINDSMPKFLLRFLLRVLTMREGAFMVVSFINHAPRAVFGGLIFGNITYYLDSAYIQNREGTSWNLMLRMIQQAFERTPKGHFVTGCSRADMPVTDALYFHNQCCSTLYPTSEVLFKFKRANLVCIPQIGKHRSDA